MSLPSIRLDALLTGRVQPFNRPGSHSAIDKQPQPGPLTVTTLGLGGDEQGDLRVHGGVEKAIHHYPYEHYAAWAAELGFVTVPRLYAGEADLHQLREWVHDKPSQFRHGYLEGLVIRRENDDWLEQRAKLVRADFTQAIDSHWRSRALEWNRVVIENNS